ncbi:MAG: porin [Gammaproteobacteria bacterium]|nr:porin [Gammaproteobacteria bacterium]
MSKKLLPVLIGAALAGGANLAAADVTLFGHIDTSYIGIDQDGGSDDTVFRCTTCSVGFKGSEDLGNGLKAIFSLDFQYDTIERNRASDGTNSITDRDQWLGLAGGFGKVRVGTISTVYKSHGAMIDPLYRTALQGRDRGLQSGFHSGAGEEIQGRATNTVRWDSPNFSGVQLGAHYTLDSDETDGEDNNPYGIGVSYSNGGILAFADYISNDGDAVSGETDAWKVGGKYDMGMFSFMGQYEDYQNSSTDEETAWHIAGGVNGLLGMNLYLGFGITEDDTSNDEATSWTLAVSHNMSKRTMVYAGHSQVDCDTGTTLSACSAVGATGGEDDRTAIGIKHKF